MKVRVARTTRVGAVVCAAVLTLSALTSSAAQDPAPPATPPIATPVALPDNADVGAAIEIAIERLLEMQEGAEWPYEGVYKVRGEGGAPEIPIGYRVGGTSICSLALVEAPGYAEDPARRLAVKQATAFIAGAIAHDLMEHEFEATYDVRGWGYAYGLLYLVRLTELGQVPDGLEETVNEAIHFYLDGIVATEIPVFGGWAYGRREGFDAPSPPSPFMTAPTLQALFAAEQGGWEVDGDMVKRALAALEASRDALGAVVYSGFADERSAGLPGSTGRMLVVENTLHLAGRGSLGQVRGALDAFLVHWPRLEERRSKNGTHKAPYGVAPYYFHFAHRYAAQAIELLPEPERTEYRARYRETLFRTRGEDGTWNDRVFPRSANYGTAMSLMGLLEEQGTGAAVWPGRQDAGLDAPETSAGPGAKRAR